MIRQIARQIFASGLPSIALVGPVTEKMLEAVGEMLTDFGEPATLVFAPRSTKTLVPA
jgi:hypothetical protein